MRAFVTGGTGFVGSHLVTALLARGNDVVCLVRDPRKAARVFAGERPPATVAGTLHDPEALRRGMEGADVVFHVAGVVAARSPDEFARANAEGTRRVAEAAREAAPGLTRLVYVSSMAAAGPSRRGQPRTEQEPPQPLTVYGRSKLAAEALLREFPIPWTVVRPPAVYGPRDREFFRVFRLASLGVGAVFGEGRQELSFIYVEDLAQALLRVANTAPGSLYFAAHPEVVTSREFVGLVHRSLRGTPATGGPFIVPVPGIVARGALWVTEYAARAVGRATLLTADKANEFLAEGFVCSSAALTRDTGWRAEWDLAGGLRRTAEWYRSAGWL